MLCHYLRHDISPIRCHSRLSDTECAISRRFYTMSATYAVYALFTPIAYATPLTMLMPRFYAAIAADFAVVLLMMMHTLDSRLPPMLRC